MKHPISQNIISRRFFAGTLAAIFSAVSFSVPSPAFAIAPNQNPTKIFSDDFENGTSKWSGFGDQISSAQVHGGTKALFYDGWPGTDASIPPTREIYVSFWWYFPPGFSGGGASGRHFWRIDVEGGPGQIDTQAQSLPNGFSIAYLDMGGKGWYPNAAQLPIGRWFKMDFYSRLNDPGVANGETALWVDGVQKFRDQNITLTNTSLRYDQFRMTSNYAYQGVCPNGNANCNWYVDDVQIWNGCPSGSPCKGGSSPVNPGPVNLTPPSNLRVVVPAP